ncbi:MAG TPA: DUF411 domain-containing protein [Steroidobacteraceae bacterium]|nr:DUF411 domain-containing protein [Steroidobacteraceae bacterium]
MWPFARNRGLEPGFSPRQQLSRRQQEARRASRVAWVIGVLAALTIGTVIVSIAPRSKPIVTVYMPPDCKPCLRWMDHLEARGFRTETGREAEWPAIRAAFGVPPRLRGSHTAIVNGLFIEGPVPAEDIHRALKLRAAYHIKGIVVLGVPRGSPGMEWALPEPYTVFAVRDGGRVQEFAEHGH